MRRVRQQSSRSTPSASGRILSMIGLAWMVFVSAACSTEEPLPPRAGEDDPNETSRRVGSLLAEFEGADEEGRDLDVHAQFLDVRGVEVDRALEALEVWSATTELDRDACTMQPGESAPTGGPRNRDVQLDLLSVGSIDVEGPGQKALELEARRLPDLLSAFSGVIYGTDRSFDDEGRQQLAFEPGADYTFRAPGDGSTGRFEVTLEAPQPVQIHPLRNRGRTEGPVVLGEGDDFEFLWSPAESEQTELYFDVAAGYGPDQPRLKCRLEDDGHFSVPAAELRGLLAEHSSTLHVALRRVSREDVEIAGIEDTDFSLSTVDRLTLELR